MLQMQRIFLFDYNIIGEEAQEILTYLYLLTINIIAREMLEICIFHKWRIGIC